MVGFIHFFMYPEKKKKEYPSFITKTTWDEPPIEPLEPKPNNSKDKLVDEKTTLIKDTSIDNDAILKFLYEYIKNYFNQFGHYVSTGDRFETWWHQHKFGTSYQPIVQMCYILKGQELGFSVREHHSQSNITELAKEIHSIEYNRRTKMKSFKNIDVCWGIDENSFGSDNLIMALEYEDSGKIDELFEELYQSQKIIKINSKFTVLGTRLNTELSFDFTKKNIEEKLQKHNLSRFFDNRFLIFIFIAPDSISNPTKICFAEYVYQNSELKRIDDKKYSFNIFFENTPEGIIIVNEKKNNN